MKANLLCTFGHIQNSNLIIDYIYKSHDIDRNPIYVFFNGDRPDDIYCTYNINGNSGDSENTILVHRKKDYNTIYTINALNFLIKRVNNGILDKSYPLDWDKYRNSLLLSQNGDIMIIPLILKTIIRK